jgi:hypothetical protein
MYISFIYSTKGIQSYVGTVPHWNSTSFTQVIDFDGGNYLLTQALLTSS